MHPYIFIFYMKKLPLFLLNSLTVALVGVASSSAYAISVSTDILRGGLATYGNLPDNTSNPGGEVNWVQFIGLGEGASFTAVDYNTIGDDFNLSPFIQNGGCCERGAGQQLQINGYNDGSGLANLYLRGESNTNNPGFGAHANWILTLDLDVVRANRFGSTTDPLTLTGDFGAWGSIGDSGATAGVITGAIFLDGARIDSMAESVANPAAVNQSFNLVLPNSGQYLTFAILNGVTATNRTLWDDGVFKNVDLEVVPEPSAALLIMVGLAGFANKRRRK